MFFITLWGIMNLAWLSCGQAGPHIVPIRYQPMGKLLFVSAKTGSTLGLCPFRDGRPDRKHIGHTVSHRRVTTYFECTPSPLGRAIRETLTQSLSRPGVRIIPIPDWDGGQESLKGIQADSVLLVDIERFWIEGRAVPRGMHLSASIYLTFHLGLKREGKVLTQRAYSSKERLFNPWTPEIAEQMINHALTETLDSFFSSLR